MPSAGDNIESVRKTLRLMEILAAHNGELTVTQLAGMLDCSVSSSNRFLQTLLHAGYVEKNPYTNRYMLTYQLYTLGHQLIEHNYMVQAMIPIAHTISQKYDISVNINGFSGKEPLLLFRMTRFYNKDLDFLSGQSALPTAPVPERRFCRSLRQSSSTRISTVSASQRTRAKRSPSRNCAQNSPRPEQTDMRPALRNMFRAFSV